MTSRNSLRKGSTAKQTLIYNTPTLIRLLEARPLLWNITNPDFYNLPERAAEWREIARGMFENYDSSSAAEQRQMILQLKTRWRHVRTAYVRHKKNPNMRKASYVYDEEMKFYATQGRSAYNNFHRVKSEYTSSKKMPRLEDFDGNCHAVEVKLPKAKIQQVIKNEKPLDINNSIENSPEHTVDEIIFEEILTHDSDISLSDDGFSYMYENEVSEDDKNKDSTNQQAFESLKNEKLQKEVQLSLVAEKVGAEGEPVQRNINQTLPSRSVPALENLETERVQQRNRKRRALAERHHDKETADDIDDDQCFFDSLKPALRDLNEDEKMDFRIAVMSILRDLKRK